MKNISILQCSPHEGGVSDTLADLYARGAESAGATVNRITLRDFRVRACSGCNACRLSPYRCVLDRDGDQAGMIFGQMLQCDIMFICSPIYFYALPAGFKALIDRAQQFWHERQSEALPHTIPVAVCLTAARKKGEKLFDGALLTLKYFLEAIGAGIAQTRLLRGMEDRAALANAPRTMSDMEAWGRSCALEDFR